MPCVGRLPPEIPHLKADVAVNDLLHVAADGGLRLDHVAEMELVEDGRLACVVEAHHHDLVLPAPRQLGPQGGDEDPHGQHGSREPPRACAAPAASALARRQIRRPRGLGVQNGGRHW
eukprot:CAMPEP_0185193030 /NCGR_PEP_ID=MMETSP1140-20130426/20259_1 /TAXON_ID=298111 /ORGANISM="Pavlova sp., Strain CCMP459" /LENGTH=117 /DNA_ID=CAMNT_0027759795 /DNA_START=534 /DNA_END=885 /DNA_ORIENTATION=-